MTINEAIDSAERYLSECVRPEIPDAVLIDGEVSQYDDGFRLSWQSKAALEGNLSATVVPAPDLWVDSVTGEVRWFDDAVPGKPDGVVHGGAPRAPR